jgi:hypothetical protein
MSIDELLDCKTFAFSGNGHQYSFRAYDGFTERKKLQSLHIINSSLMSGKAGYRKDNTSDMYQGGNPLRYQPLLSLQCHVIDHGH